MKRYYLFTYDVKTDHVALETYSVMEQVIKRLMQNPGQREEVFTLVEK